jgi:hypothetical protein
VNILEKKRKRKEKKRKRKEKKGKPGTGKAHKDTLRRKSLQFFPPPLF